LTFFYVNANKMIASLLKNNFAVTNQRR